MLTPAKLTERGGMWRPTRKVCVMPSRLVETQVNDEEVRHGIEPLAALWAACFVLRPASSSTRAQGTEGVGVSSGLQHPLVHTHPQTGAPDRDVEPAAELV